MGLSDVALEWNQKVSPPGISSRFLHDMASVWNDQKVVLFGGYNYNTAFGDTWVYDSFTESWTQKTPSKSPNARYFHAMSSIYGNSDVLLFGGTNNNNNYFNDTWVYDIGTDTWTKVNTPSAPSHRRSHAMTFIWGTSKVILYGGAGYTSSDKWYNDTWIFDYSNKTWTELNLTNGPGRRINHEMATIWGTDKVVLYGGQDCYNAFRETWIFDLSENNWTKQEPKKIPTALFGFDFSHVWNSHYSIYG